MAIVIKAALLAFCPLVLYALHFFTPEELARGRELASRGRMTLSEWIHRAASSRTRDG